MHRTLLLAVIALTSSCAASRHVSPSLADLRASAPPLEENHFFRDRTGLGEAELQTILASPVFLEEHARIGVLPVQYGYAPAAGLPIDVTPATLVASLESSGLFDLASEIASEWPTSSGTAGLRELAARYRTEYVLLYRHRFDDQTHANGFAAGFVTLIGALFLPGTTIESSGVLEATLFDVKTGTILFTVHERVKREAMTLPLAVEGRIQDFHDEMTKEAAKMLSEQVVTRCQRLIATRPAKTAAVASALPSP